jgi:xylan 1,4-beta-xylosidase
MKRRNVRLALVAAGVAACFSLAQAANYTLTVNAGTKTGAWNRFYEKGVASCHAYTVINSSFGRNIANALKIAHDSAGFQYHRCHGVLDDDVHPYVAAGSYNWTNMDTIYDRVILAGMRPVVEISFTPPAIASAASTLSLWYNGVQPNNQPPNNWTNWRNFITAMVQHLETRYGAAEVRNNWLFEIWNEPDWMYTGFTPYLTLYDNTAAAIVAADANIRVGGPAQSGPSSIGSVSSLIDHCRSGSVKLDFVSWHRYANDNGYGGQVSNPNSMNSFCRAMDSLVRAKSFTGLSVNDEWGPTYNTDHRDDETAASFVVKTIHLINSNGSPYTPPYMFGYWVISDMYEEFNGTGQTAFRSSGQYGMLLVGSASITQSQDVAKPVFNAFKMLHKLGDTTLSCTGGTTNDGLNLLATVNKTHDTVCVMTYTHYNGGTGNSATTDNVSLTISGLPFTRMKIEHLVLDRTHSNTYQTWTGLGSPANPTATQWTTIANAAQLATYDAVKPDTTIASASYTKAFTQNYYSVGLIRLSKISTNTVAGPSKKFLDLVKGLQANMIGKNLVLDLPFPGPYTVRLFSTNGRKILDKQVCGPGRSGIALERVPAGTYLIKCSGAFKTMTARVAIER